MDKHRKLIRDIPENHSANSWNIWNFLA